MRRITTNWFVVIICALSVDPRLRIHTGVDVIVSIAVTTKTNINIIIGISNIIKIVIRAE